MNIDKQKQEDGSYLDPEGCHHDDAESYIQCYVLGFCGCGMAETNLRYVRDCLRHIANLRLVWEKEKPESEAAYKEWDEAGKKLMGNAEYFTRYVLDQKELTEHGGSVGGAWLTDKGEELLADLDALLANESSSPTAGGGNGGAQKKD